MNLAQALKKKNRLAGEIVRHQRILQRENSRRSDNPSKVDCVVVWAAFEKISDELGNLKASIARANVPIYSKIERMAELKSQIAFIENLEKREGEEISSVGFQEKLTYNWTSFINQERADAMTVTIQNQINTIQDEIDEFNASTQV